MRYLAFACDYDGTIAHHGRVDDATLAALERVRASGRKLLLVTGRRTSELTSVFARVDVFDRVVAENGAVIYDPRTGREEALAEPPPPRLISALRERGVVPLSVGRTIVATWRPNETTVLETIRDLGLEHHLIFNKGAVMVLPTGVSKATGLTAALRELGLSEHNAVGVGDAENDHAFLTLCECSAVVNNALPSLKERAEIVLERDHGAGVQDLIDELLATDLADRAQRRCIPIGVRPDGTEVCLPPYGETVLIAGNSGAGKSSLATAFMERLAREQYQLCVIDPEGDYEFLARVAMLGTSSKPPSPDEVVHLLADPMRSAVVSFLGVPLVERPTAFSHLLKRLYSLRERVGLPHWIIVDEAHHVMPAVGDPEPAPLHGMMGAAFITVECDTLDPRVLQQVSVVVAVGEHPANTLADYCAAVGEPPPVNTTVQPGESLVWFRRGVNGRRPEAFAAVPVQSERRRHRRKYAEGELAPDRSFYFLGPRHRLRLRAQNLMLFLQIGEGVDHDTWEYHRRRGDYSAWMRRDIKDEALAEQVAAIEADTRVDTDLSRSRIRALIEQRYTAPA